MTRLRFVFWGSFQLQRPPSGQAPILAFRDANAGPKGPQRARRARTRARRAREGERSETVVPDATDLTYKMPTTRQAIKVATRQTKDAIHNTAELPWKMASAKGIPPL